MGFPSKFTIDDLDRLDKAIASGVLRVMYDGNREVTYRSMAELERARGLVASSLGETTTAEKPPVAHRSVFYQG